MNVNLLQTGLALLGAAAIGYAIFIGVQELKKMHGTDYNAMLNQ